MLDDPLYLPPSSFPIMIMEQRESKPTDLNVHKCQKAIRPSVLPNVEKKKKKIAGQEKPRNNGEYSHLAWCHLPQNSEAESK